MLLSSMSVMLLKTCVQGLILCVISTKINRNTYAIKATEWWTFLKGRLNKPWRLEFDLLCKGTSRNSCAIVINYYWPFQI